MKALKNRVVFISVAGLLLFGGGACSSPPTIRGFFEQESERLSPPERRLLVETLRVLSLLENYRAALEAREMAALLACYSAGYSHYEQGLDWLKERMEERFFAPFAELSVSMRDLSIEFVQKDSGYWLRQEDFDWLRGTEGKRMPDRSFLITVNAAAGPIKMELESTAGEDTPSRTGSPSRSAGREISAGVTAMPGEPLTVTVRSSVDRGVERPLGEVSFRLLIKGVLADTAGPGVFSCAMEEKVILLLEQEEGRWKITSQW
ncbi:MAG: hypothetical protein V1789_04055 [PVC group bacterium]